MRPLRHKDAPSVPDQLDLTHPWNLLRYAAGMATEAVYVAALMAVALALAFLALWVW